MEETNTCPGYGDSKLAQVAVGNNSNNFGRQRYVSFYFTNFPVQLSLFYLRKGFEVCGILEDIYVARKRNKQGHPYGFVRFSNVRDITKLTKALNVVCFGDFRVRARVARFDRNNATADKSGVASMKAGVLGAAKGVDKLKAQIVGSDDGKPRVEAKPRSESLAVKVNEGVDPQEEVRVGDGLVSKFHGSGIQKQGDVKQQEVDTVEGQDSRIYVRSYKAAPDDVDWAQCGVVATIANGEAGSVVRRRLEDAGFKGLDLIHLGVLEFLFGAWTGQM
jgi:hypothetical protein